jgi:hypothetical protein
MELVISPVLMASFSFENEKGRPVVVHTDRAA